MLKCLLLVPSLPSVPGPARLGDMRRAFPGYGTAFLPSLVLAASELVQDLDRTGSPSKGSLSRRPAYSRAAGGTAGDGSEARSSLNAEPDEEGATPEEQMYRLCVEGLLRVTTPEVMCRLTQLSSSGKPGSWAKDRRQGECDIDGLLHAAGETPEYFTWG